MLAAAALAVLPVSQALAAPADSDQMTARLLDLTNVERTRAGLPPLTISVSLQDAAQRYSGVLAFGSCFEHTCGPVPSFADRDELAGYTDWSAIGENLAGGYVTPEAVLAGWMASPEHRANILSATFTEIGIGVTTSDGRYSVYWTEEFGTRDE
jgi:uncharacterized protein YkwD